MILRLRLYGVFRSAAGQGEVAMEIPGTVATVRSAIAHIVSQKRFQTMKQLLIETEAADPRPNALIMVSGKEINSLDGLETELKDGDQLELLPVAHGG